ncbi:FMN-binding domain-containing protein [Saccharothrix sp. ALI-22-I]|uniref:FMN-binding protein n=1 Tax=Saccharothrix sp. ALI-22-I TaxID=1933778 RepID=UPI00097BC90A|nr:FMN-binding protein [Saccharothrix sp. ALI-22-I]ONI82656.1 FMN-binding domain-containing protein [Saccharothrix sp. ALI-22-I]
MKRAVPILLLTIAGVVPLWRFEAEPETVAAAEAPAATEAPGTSEAPATSQAPGATEAPAAAVKTVTGSLVRTSYGDVQVQLTFEGDVITKVTMVKQPNSAPTKKAVPVLVQETLDAQSADVDTVSGATTTSGAYVQSLQAAIDAKGD